MFETVHDATFVSNRNSVSAPESLLLSVRESRLPAEACRMKRRNFMGEDVISVNVADWNGLRETLGVLETEESCCISPRSYRATLLLVMRKAGNHAVVSYTVVRSGR